MCHLPSYRGAALNHRMTVLVGSGSCITRAQVFNCDPAVETVGRAALDLSFAGSGDLQTFVAQTGNALTLPAGDICLQVHVYPSIYIVRGIHPIIVQLLSQSQCQCCSVQHACIPSSCYTQAGQLQLLILGCMFSYTPLSVHANFQLESNMNSSSPWFTPQHRCTHLMNRRCLQCISDVLSQQVCSMLDPVSLASITVLPAYKPKINRAGYIIEAEDFDISPKAVPANPMFLDTTPANQVRQVLS